MSNKRKELWRNPSFNQSEFENKRTKAAKLFTRSKSFQDPIHELTLSSEGGFSRNKASVATKNPLLNASQNWVESFEPQNIEDLAVHTKKIDEVRNFLKHCEFMAKKKSPNQIGLISGPAGAGKTATLKVLSKNLGFEIVEWITPVEFDVECSETNGFKFRESQLSLFKRFVFQSSRYKTLFETSNKRILLVEDFPNSILREPTLLIEILDYFKVKGKCPLVFIVTDSKSRDLNISYNLFPDSIKDKYDISHISFNSIAPTIMKKTLKRIASKIPKNEENSFSVPNQEILDSISISSDGDIRSAVINLYFASLKGTKICLKSNKQNKKTKTKLQNKKLSSVGKDESITLMHAMGRVFNPKYHEEKANPKFVYSPEALSEQFVAERRNFIDLLEANYISHFTGMENVADAAECLSLSDTFMTEYREDVMGSIGFNVAIRGLMVSNSNPAKGWAPIRGVKKLDKSNSYLKELQGVQLGYNITKNLYATDMRSYIKLIKT